METDLWPTAWWDQNLGQVACSTLSEAESLLAFDLNQVEVSLSLLFPVLLMVGSRIHPCWTSFSSSFEPTAMPNRIGVHVWAQPGGVAI